MKFNRSVFPVAVFFTINMLLFQNMAKIYEFSFLDNRIRLVCYGALAVLAGGSVVRELFSCRGLINLNSFGVAVLCYSVALGILLVMHRNIVSEVLLNCYMVLFAMIASYYAFKRGSNVQWWIAVQNIILIVLWAMFMYNKLFLHQSGAPRINSIYYVILLTPFALCVRSRIMCKTLIVLISVAAVISLKRTAVVIWLVSLFVYYIMKNQNDWRRVVTIVFLSGFVILMIFVVQKQTGIDILGRFQDTVEDGGSGRLEMYTYLVKNLLNRDLKSILIGEGYYTVTKMYGGTAHNDFLEILYDFGIIGLLMYLSMYGKLISAYKKMKQENYQYRIQFLVSIFAFFIMSTFSHVIMIPTYIMFLALFWGLILGDFWRELQIKCI